MLTRRFERALPLTSLAVLLATCHLTSAAPAPAPAPAPAAKPDPAGVEFFEKKVRPVLAQSCYKCHSATSDKLKAKLYLDSRDGMLKGGESGPAVVPGKPEKSLLIEAVRWTNDEMKMPPKTRLPDAVVADLVKWVQMGAPWPDGGGAKPLTGATAQTPAAGPAGAEVLKNIYGVEYDKLRREHWAWQPVKAPAVPTPKTGGWAKTDIDRFLLAGMEAKGVHPVGDADKPTLIRRVYLDLTGLPPTPADVEAFVNDPSADAFDKVADRLLAGPRFGERWGRHWLDVARYAESTGSTRNIPYSHAWRYRDYVIDAFNKDKPYDRFVREQLAGDLLPFDTAAQHNEQRVATGFLALGVKDLNERDRLQFQMDNVDEQIDTMSRSVLALTVSCARCHDHKFDPIPTADYYAVAGIFKSTEILSGVQGRNKAGAGRNYDAPDLLVRLDKTSGPASGGPAAPAGSTVAAAAPSAPSVDKQKVTELAAKLEKAYGELRQIRAEAQAAGGAKQPKAAGKPALRARVQEKRAEIEKLETKLAAAQGGTKTAAPDATPAPAAPAADAAGDLAVGVHDAARPGDARICIRGDTDNLGPDVPRGFVGVLRLPSQPSIASNHSGRLELAQWATSPDNPLTARVMVNRVWQHLFGQGIVRTVDNFGTTGEAPGHPELLDFLATRFVRDGWSMKKTIRAIVLSRAYQQAGTYDSANFQADPGDRLVWRMAPKRLEAEALRDAMLAVSGRLETARPQGSPVAALPVGELGKFRADRMADADRSYRSVYLPILRNMLPAALDVFDFAEPTMVTGSRDVTTVPTQALYLMNNGFVIDQARGLADKVLAAKGLDDAGRVDLVYKTTLARPATAAERARAVQYVAAYAREDAGNAKDPAKAKAEAWASLCQALFCSAEFRYVN